ncbi:Glycoprotein 3-alpha-L-fucosyltransferase A [Armadillidium vulgare]|nr:Glycoprotein 3-alpha-L-fucosyltransferase A [Armadillidium vulgare]
MKTKKKLVAWMVSQCVTPSNRFQYVSQFMENVWVDIYGGCGKLKCDREKTEKCYEMFERKYKFYFSFENSFCKDYVTEKFFNILSYYIIPVVMGGADYAAIAPPYSYINVEDFESPKDLANYLIYLDKNDTAYMEYFK